MSNRRKRATRKRLLLRKAVVLLVQSAVVVVSLFAYWYLFFSKAGANVPIPLDLSLAAYDAQIQVLGILASLPPLLFVVREKVKPLPSRSAIQLAVVYASFMIISSMIGITLGLFGIINAYFDVSSVVLPLLFAFLDADFLLLYVCRVAGVFDRLLSWAQWSFE